MTQETIDFGSDLNHGIWIQDFFKTAALAEVCALRVLSSLNSNLAGAYIVLYPSTVLFIFIY